MGEERTNEAKKARNADRIRARALRWFFGVSRDYRAQLVALTTMLGFCTALVATAVSLAYFRARDQALSETEAQRLTTSVSAFARVVLTQGADGRIAASSNLLALSEHLVEASIYDRGGALVFTHRGQHAGKERNNLQSYSEAIVSESGSPLGTARILAADALRPSSGHGFFLLGLSLTVGVVSWLLARAFWPFASAPIKRLRLAMERIAETGDYTCRLDGAGADEFGRLVGAFNDMIGEVRRRDEANAAMLYDLEVARDAAERASRAKGQFLAVMSHELRTPLNAVIGYAELIQEELAHGARPSDLIDDAQRIRSSAQGLLELINGVLDMSRAESGRLVVDWRVLDPVILAREVVSSLSPLAAKKGNRLLVETNLKRIELTTDPIRLRQCLVNLVGNAVKFTDNGEVALRLSLHERPNGEPGLRFEVADTGPGLTPEQIERLFRPFSQLDSSSARRHEGAGLGLAISRKLINLLGGDVSVSSAPGVGSIFIIDLPMRPPAAATIGEQVFLAA